MAEKLTLQQQMAVDNRGGKLLVSAAAGSGKTKVLVDRLLKYIKDPINPANIDEFLIITYTKAAAAELRSKIAAKLSEHIAMEPENRHLQRQLQRLYLTKISTVHSFCSDILREYAYRLDISPDFRVADENEVTQLRSRAVEQILEAAYENLGLDADFQAFVDTQGLGRSDALVPEIVLQVYDSAMCHTDPQKWCDDCLKNAAGEGIADPTQTIWGRYLMDDLFDCLDDQIASLVKCTDAVSGVPGLEKPAALLSDTVYQLRHLREAATWDEILERKNIEYGRLIFSKKADLPEITEPIKAVRSACKDTLDKKLKVFSDTSQQVLFDLQCSGAAARGLMSLVQAFRDTFSRMKRQRRVLDFADLEHKTLDLLLGKSRSTPTSAAREIGSRFREIMVDEYQDSNGVQDAIFSSLTDKRQNLFMVGDVKQSIYQFRLADPLIFLEKYATYAAAEDAAPGEGRKVLLSSNFRSSGSVIECANFVFETCMTTAVGGIDYTEAEALKEGIPHIPLQEPEIELYGIRVSEDTYAEEAAFVADRICQLLDGSHMIRDGEILRPITEEDIVILLRSPGSVGADFMDALSCRGIRCTSGTGTDLLMTREVSTLRSLLHVIGNPRQDIPLLAVLASPVFGFSADELASIRGGNRNVSLYEALAKSDSPKALEFIHTLNLLRRTSAMESLGELFERIFNITRLDTIFSAIDPTSRENLLSFYQLAVEFGGAGGGDLQRFLTHLESLDDRGLPGSQEAASGCVTIMSIHKSKGLEFPVVFLCGLSKRFNRDDLRAQVLCHKEMGLGLSCVDEENRVRYPALSKAAIAARLASDSLSEEMRVLYVAMTRAKDRMIMTYASQYLDNEIRDIALRMDICGTTAMTRNVTCPGQWLLYSALHRTEAGAFFALGNQPRNTVVTDNPWYIRIIDGGSSRGEAHFSEKSVSAEMPEALLEQLREDLSFRYTHTAATTAPSKQTATQRKGRLKDQEAAEDAPEEKQKVRAWRNPSFSHRQPKGIAYGNAMHAVLQYIRYDCCDNRESIDREIHRLEAEGYITQEHARLADRDKLYLFFCSPMGEKLRTSEHVLREFKFSILDDGTSYGQGLEGERILLQGVVDCALIEEDGITIIDFKTDYVTEETVASLTASYAPQVKTYGEAMERIYELPVKTIGLYFFRLNRFVWL